MMWPFRRRASSTLTEARAARVQAEQDLRAVRAETPRYRALGEALREVRERNNFAAAIEASFRGGKS